MNRTGPRYLLRLSPMLRALMDVLGFHECGYSEVKYARRQLSGRLKYLKRSGTSLSFGTQCLFEFADPHAKENADPLAKEKQSALEEASKTDSTASGEARQRSEPRPRIPGLEGRAADSAMLERHAGQHGSSSSAIRHETIPCRP